METKGYIIIFGLLGIVLALIILGALYSKIILTLGIVGFIAWIIWIFNLAIAMGSDI